MRRISKHLKPPCRLKLGVVSSSFLSAVTENKGCTWWLQLETHHHHRHMMTTIAFHPNSCHFDSKNPRKTKKFPGLWIPFEKVKVPASISIFDSSFRNFYGNHLKDPVDGALIIVHSRYLRRKDWFPFRTAFLAIQVKKQISVAFLKK